MQLYATGTTKRIFLALTLITFALSLSATQTASARSKKVTAPAETVVAPVKRTDDPGCRECVSHAASLFARGDGNNAEKLLREWAPKCPNSTQLHMLFSTILIGGGHNAEAEQESRIATENSPSSISAHLQHALTLTALDKKMQAAREFERVTELDPSCYEAWLALGSIYRQLHEDDKASEAMAKASDMEPQSKSVRMGTLSNLKRAGKYTEARAEIRRLLAASTTTPEFAEDLARESLLVGGFDEAAQASAKAISAYPKSVAPLIISALAHCCVNNYGATIDESSKAVELEPANVDARSVKGLALAKTSKLEEAEAAVKDVSDTNSAMYWLTKGSIESARSNYPAAEEALRSCLEFDQGNNAMQGIPHGLARLALADVYKRQGKTALAAEQMQALARDKRFANPGSNAETK